MKIDRAAFLAITATLAVGCAATTVDEQTIANDEAAISASGGKYCYTATEGTGDYAERFFIPEIGFDPVNDFPSAEGFCFDAASTGKNDADGFPELNRYIYRQCNAIAKIYVPQVVYTSFSELKRTLRTDMPERAKWDALRKVQRDIAADGFFCVTRADRAVCKDAADKPACLRVSTQLVPAAKAKLDACLDKWDAYTCIEGGNQLR